MRRVIVGKAGWILTHLAMVSVLAGCITEEELQAVAQERDALRAKVKELEMALDESKGQVKELEAELEKRKAAVASRPNPQQVATARAELKLESGQDLRVTFETTLGDIVCEMWPEVAPSTVLNFVGLAEGSKEWVEPKSKQKTTQKLYDGTIFHRVIDGFMIQGGDPLGTGRGGPGYRFSDEVWPDIVFDREGLLAMANAGPNTNGSQFFITVSKPTYLNGRHTIFGECELEVVRKIAKTPVDERDRPTTDVVVKKVVVERVPEDNRFEPVPVD